MNIFHLYTLPLTLEQTFFRNISKKLFLFVGTYFKHTITIVLGSLVVHRFNYSELYHLMKRQDFVKVYVLFNVLELLERLVVTVIEDLVELSGNLDTSVSMCENEDYNGIKFDNDTKNHKERYNDVFKAGGVDSVIDFNQSGCAGNFSFAKGVNLRDREFSYQIYRGKEEKSDESIDLNSINNFGDKKYISLKENTLSFTNPKIGNNEKHGPAANTTQYNGALFSILFMFFNILQGLILFTEFVLIRISMNKMGDLLGLLISNQFIDIKGTIFRKVNKKLIAEIFENDARKRFQLTMFVCMLIAANIREMIMFKVEYVMLPLIVILFKIGVDWVKHVFLCRYNDVDMAVYGCFEKVEKRDVSLGFNLMMASFLYSIVFEY